MSIAELRKSYEKKSLLEADLATDPFVQFDHWFQEALDAGIAEANAMTLATVGADLRPSSRIVLIKGYEVDQAAAGATGRGLVWYTNYESRKGRELAINAAASLQFHWVELERQVRVEGFVERTSAEQSDEYFHSRPIASRIGAWASPQSEVIGTREELDAREEEMKARLGEAMVRPPHWGGYRLVPDCFEFWQGRPSRLHDRIRYRRGPASHWKIERLAP